MVRLRVFLITLFVASLSLTYVQSSKASGAEASGVNSYLNKILDPKIYSLKELAAGIAWKNPDKHKAIADQLTRDEMTFQVITGQLLIPFQRAVLGRQLSSLNSFFKDGKENVNGLALQLSKVSREFDGIKMFKFADQNQVAGAELPLAPYVDQFEDIKDFRIDVTAYYADMADRDSANADIKKMKLHGQFDLRGLTKTKMRRNDRGPIELSVENWGSGWKIVSIQLGQLESVVTKRAPAFVDITDKAFADGSPEIHLRREAIRRGGYALALADINDDGNVDMFVGSRGPSSLWRGSGDGRFHEIKKSAVAQDKLVKTAIFADFTNSGKKDLFVTSFTPNKGEEDLVVYENQGHESFKRLGDPARGFSRLASYYPMPATVGDFNEDGLLDVYVGFPGARDFTFLSVTGNQVNGGDKLVQGLFMNKGNLTFNESKMNIPTMQEGNRQYLYPHSALAVDLHQNHHMDIVVIDDQDNLSPVYQNNGLAVFEQVADKIGLADSSNAMSAAVGDFNNDGLLDFVLTSANSFSAQRLQYALANHWHEPTPGLDGKAVRLFQQAKNGKFIDVTDAAGLDFAGAGGAGVEFVDYNNDGLLDIFVSNGLWSGDDRYQDASYILDLAKYRNRAHADVIKDRSDSAQSDFMNFLIGFRGNLFTPDHKGTNSISASGYQRKRLFRNNGDGTFTDVAFLEGVDSIFDGYSVAKVSLTKDGKQDLILHNADPGQDSYKFPPVQIFKNGFPGNKSVEIKLVGHSVNRDAVGVGVSLRAAGKTYYQQLIGNNGPAQSEEVLHFGLGRAKLAEQVTVHWPNGDQILRNVKPGRITIDQPGKQTNALLQINRMSGAGFAKRKLRVGEEPWITR